MYSTSEQFSGTENLSEGYKGLSEGSIRLIPFRPWRRKQSQIPKRSAALKS